MIEELRTTDFNIAKSKQFARLIIRKNKFRHHAFRYYWASISIMVILWSLLCYIQLILGHAPKTANSYNIIIISFLIGTILTSYCVFSTLTSEKLMQFKGSNIVESNKKATLLALQKLGWMIVRNTKDLSVALTENGSKWLIIFYAEGKIFVGCNNGNTNCMIALPISPLSRKKYIDRFYKLFYENINEIEG